MGLKKRIPGTRATKKDNKNSFFFHDINLNLLLIFKRRRKSFKAKRGKRKGKGKGKGKGKEKRTETGEKLSADAAIVKTFAHEAVYS